MSMKPDRDELAERVLTQQQQAMAARLPERLQPPLWWAVSHWPGRIALRFSAGLRQLQIFDRSMTIAAQLFTSLFPILIMGAAFVGADPTTEALDSPDLPEETSAVLDQVVVSGEASTFGLVGMLVVLASATSLSRALTRAYDTIWQHDRTRTSASQAWRWLAAVMVLAVAVVLSRFVVRAVSGIPPRDVWSTSVAFAINAGVAVIVPWLLMAGRVRVRLLAPGALLFALVLMLGRPLTTAYLTQAVGSSAERYGSIGVAFTYLTFLYCVAFVLLAAAVLGQVVATDEGSWGRVVRGSGPVPARTQAEVPAEP